jgi:hypothetical protein
MEAPSRNQAPFKPFAVSRLFLFLLPSTHAQPQLQRIFNVSFVADLLFIYLLFKVERFSFFPARIPQHNIFSPGGMTPYSAPQDHMSQHDWLTPPASHPISVPYTSQILADPLSLTGHLYHFHSAQLTPSTTWQRGTPERGAALLRYRCAALFKRARIAAPQLVLSRPIKSSVHLVVALQLNFHLEKPDISGNNREITFWKFEIRKVVHAIPQERQQHPQ